MRLQIVFLIAFLLQGTLLLAQKDSPVTLQQHSARLLALHAVAQQCSEASTNCDGAKVGPDETLVLPGGVQASIRYQWLRKALNEAKQAKPDDREASMQAVLTRLDAHEAQPAGPSTADARRNANAILQQVEFAASKPSWLETQWDRLMKWLGQHLDAGEPSASVRSWLRFFVEFGLFAVPVVLLCVWLFRQIKEDRLVPEHSRASAVRRTSGTNWLEEAHASAAKGDWREAIHALYWQSITAFEERRIWSVSRTRTPREYLSLLAPGTAQRHLLREKTTMLESIWYGHREATESDYRRAAELTEELARA